MKMPKGMRGLWPSAMVLMMFAVLLALFCFAPAPAEAGGGAQAFINSNGQLVILNAAPSRHGGAVIFSNGGGRHGFNSFSIKQNGRRGPDVQINVNQGRGFFVEAPVSNASTVGAVAFGGTKTVLVDAVAVPGSTVFVNANKLRFNTFGTATTQDVFGNVYEIDGLGNARFVGNRLGASGFAPATFGFGGHLSNVNNVIFTDSKVRVFGF